MITTASMVASGCSSDRFHNQVGCTSDSECRADRICEQNRCIALSEVDRTSGEDAEDGDVGPDATPDIGPDAEPGDQTNNGPGTLTEEERAMRQFLGTWRTEVDGRMHNPDGSVTRPPVPSSLLVDIGRVGDTGLSIEIDHSLICALEASVRAGPSFVLTTRECRAGDENMSLLYSNIAGSGRLDDDGELDFSFTSDATFNAGGSSYALELTFEGPRID